jgi:hypothetical protein
VFDEEDIPEQYEQYKKAMIEDDDYLYERHHKYWAKTTEEMKDIPPKTFNFEGEEITYESEYSVHVRNTEENWYGYNDPDSQDRFVKVSKLAPIAE